MINIGKSRAKADLQKATGTHRRVGKNLGELEIGGHEAELLKIELNKLYSDGWICRLKDTGEVVSAFNTFDLFDQWLPHGILGENILNLNPLIDVLLLQSRNGDEWYILKCISKNPIEIEPGERILHNGQSRFILKNDKIEFTTPNLIVNDKQFEELIGIEDLETYIPPIVDDRIEEANIPEQITSGIIELVPPFIEVAIEDLQDADEVTALINSLVPGLINTAIIDLLDEEEVNALISTALVNYYTKTNVDTLISGFLDQTEVDARVNALGPGIADTEIQNNVPGMIETAINTAGAALIEMIVPVGTIITSADGTNPGTRIPGTTWVAEAQGKFILGVGGSYTNGATGGATTVTLGVNNLPSHKHNVAITSSGAHTSGAPSNNSTDSSGASTSGSGGSDNTGGTAPSTNSTGAHNHVLKMKLHGASGTDKYNAYASGDYESLSAVQSGGEHYHTVNSHTHTIPAHTHTTPAHSHSLSNHTHQVQNHSHTVSEDNIGSAAPISIMPPYIARYMWRRTA